MTSGMALQPEDTPILACTISRDVQIFDLLIEDMEAAVGEAWGDLGFNEAIPFLQQPEAAALEFVAMAVDSTDEDNIVLLCDVIQAAKARGIRVILIAEDVKPAALHQLLRMGADEFIPYPLPENELQMAIQRLRQPPPQATAVAQVSKGSPLTAGDQRNGVVVSVQGLAGGTGASTLAVNMAWELANLGGGESHKVCILDFDLQFGSTSTYLDLPRRDAVFELLSDTESMDDEVFGQALLAFEDKLQVLTAPADIIPLDLVSSDDIQRLVDTARRHFDYVVIDMPQTFVSWTETVLNAAHVYFALVELDMRSAQNALRVKRALQSEDLPFNKLRFVMNRAPKFADLNGRARVKRMAESLGISIDVLLPDGGRQVTQGADHGLPLASSAPKNPLRREIAKLAASLHDVGQNETEAA